MSETGKILEINKRIPSWQLEILLTTFQKDCHLSEREDEGDGKSC